MNESLHVRESLSLTDSRAYIPSRFHAAIPEAARISRELVHT